MEEKNSSVAYWLDQFLRGHRWKVTTEDVYGPATHTRVCLTCGIDETYLYDFRRGQMVWRRGTFRPGGKEYFIIAAQRESYEFVRDHIREHIDKEAVTLWLRFPSDVRDMCRYYPWPRLRLAADYTEADVAQMREIKKILQTGHV